MNTKTLIRGSIDRRPHPDAEKLEAMRLVASYLESPQGTVFVEMQESPTEIGGILIAERARDKGQPDIGLVLSAGIGIPLHVGDVVVVRHGDGTQRSGWEHRGYKTRKTRAYGRFVPYTRPGESRTYDWSESVMAVWTEDDKLIPLRKNIVIRRAEHVDRVGSIILPDKSQYRTGEAEVLAIGDTVRDVKVGDTVLYHQRATKDNSVDMEMFGERLAMVEESGIELILR